VQRKADHMKLETSLGMHFYSIQNETCQKKTMQQQAKGMADGTSVLSKKAKSHLL
jgi:hypothetical protein